MLSAMSEALSALRAACAEVASRAGSVSIDAEAVPAYAAGLPLSVSAAETEPQLASREERAAFWLTLDAINFGSGWFPTLRKPPGHSGYDTVAAGVRAHGPWSAEELRAIEADVIAEALGQDPGHELMALFAHSLNDLGEHIATAYAGRFELVLEDAQGSAAALAALLGSWDCFADVSRYEEIELPFLKRAQIAAADLARAEVYAPPDLDRLTMFADNLVPHVLRLDGILCFDAELVARIEREELIEHGSPEEVEIRACALHAVELILAQRRDSSAAAVDQVLWNRGREPRYKARPRHRSRCTAY
jgi:Queuosine salvage protein